MFWLPPLAPNFLFFFIWTQSKVKTPNSNGCEVGKFKTSLLPLSPMKIWPTTQNSNQDPSTNENTCPSPDQTQVEELNLGEPSNHPSKIQPIALHLAIYKYLNPLHPHFIISPPNIRNSGHGSLWMQKQREHPSFLFRANHPILHQNYQEKIQEASCWYYQPLQLLTSISFSFPQWFSTSSIRISLCTKFQKEKSSWWYWFNAMYPF